MATQRRFEGNTLAEVLAKVQQEVGTDAQIASAQKVRSGGAFGFFQKERFEVLVDVPDRVAAPAPTPRPTSSTFEIEEDDDTLTPASLLELAQQISREERRDESAASAPTPVAKEQPAEPTMSTESDVFADVLSRMAFQADMGGAVDSAPEGAAATAPSSFIPGRPAFLDEPAHIDPAAPEPVVAHALIPTPLASPAPAAAPLPAVVEPEPVPVAEPVPAPAVRTRITDHPLARLGLPGSYIPTDVDVVDLRAALTESLEENLPKTPVIRPSRGSIIAIVGDREDAVRIAADIAREFGRPDEEIVVASQHVKGKMADNVLRTVENAEDAQRSWSRRNRPTIVAIEAYPGSRDTSWAEHVLTALEPIATFGVLDATRKAEDIAAWADALGGIDCLAVNNIEETVSPAAVLHAGIPVERIDGRKATPEYWALLLTERLSAA